MFQAEGTIYEVVGYNTHMWQDLKWVDHYYKTTNLLDAYTYLQKLEAEDEARSYHDAGSPVRVTYKIETYLNGDCK